MQVKSGFDQAGDCTRMAASAPYLTAPGLPAPQLRPPADPRSGALQSAPLQPGPRGPGPAAPQPAHAAAGRPAGGPPPRPAAGSRGRRKTAGGRRYTCWEGRQGVEGTRGGVPADPCSRRHEAAPDPAITCTLPTTAQRACTASLRRQHPAAPRRLHSSARRCLLIRLRACRRRRERCWCRRRRCCRRQGRALPAPQPPACLAARATFLRSARSSARGWGAGCRSEHLGSSCTCCAALRAR